jgi:hypothetical protein
MEENGFGPLANANLKWRCWRLPVHLSCLHSAVSESDSDASAVSFKMDTWRAYKGISFLGHTSDAAMVALDDTMALHDPATTADADLRSEMKALHKSLKAVHRQLCYAVAEARALLPQQLAIAEDLKHIQPRTPAPEASASPPDPLYTPQAWPGQNTRSLCRP